MGTGPADYGYERLGVLTTIGLAHYNPHFEVPCFADIRLAQMPPYGQFRGGRQAFDVWNHDNNRKMVFAL